MSNNKLVASISRGVHKIGFKARKHSPEILIVTGVIGVVTSTVMACKATTKLSEVLDESKDQLNTIHQAPERAELKEKYTEEDMKKDLTIVYVQTGLKVVKLYAPAVALGALSLTAIIGSHKILTKRNAALTAAYATLDKSFKNYRSGVLERFGEECDKELKYGIKAKEFEKKESDPKTGEEKVTKETVKVSELDGYSEYARFFDESSRYWQKNSEQNLMFLRSTQAIANDMLKRDGLLFVNQVYDMLDIPKTKAGQIIGWVYDLDNPDCNNCVDFGIYELNREKNRDFVNGYERSILLDFNVDGNVWEGMA